MPKMSETKLGFRGDYWTVGPPKPTYLDNYMLWWDIGV